MINSTCRFFLFFTLLLVTSACNNQPTKLDSNSVAEMAQDKKLAPQKLLRHVVLFNFNEDATPEIVQKIETEFAGLPNKISEIYSFEWGINNSPEGLDKGLTHCFLVSFLSEEGREKYLPHPDHLEFVKFIGPYVEDVTVVDYWAE